MYFILSVRSHPYIYRILLIATMKYFSWLIFLLLCYLDCLTAVSYLSFNFFFKFSIRI
jgi:hypothetical protein